MDNYFAANLAAAEGFSAAANKNHILTSVLAILAAAALNPIFRQDCQYVDRKTHLWVRKLPFEIAAFAAKFASIHSIPVTTGTTGMGFRLTLTTFGTYKWRYTAAATDTSFSTTTAASTTSKMHE